MERAVAWTLEELTRYKNELLTAIDFFKFDFEKYEVHLLRTKTECILYVNYLEIPVTDENREWAIIFCKYFIPGCLIKNIDEAVMEYHNREWHYYLSPGPDYSYH